MSSKMRILFVVLMVVVDAAATAIAFYLAYTLRSLVPFPVPLSLGPFTNYLGLLVIQVCCLLVTFFFYRLYHPHRIISRIDLLSSIVGATSIAMLASTVLAFLVYRTDRELTRGMLLYEWALTIILVTLSHVFMERVQRNVRSKHPERLLLVGTGEIARMIYQKTLQSPHLGYQVVGFVNENGAGGEVAGVPILGSRADLARILRDHNVQEVVIALPDASHEEMLDMIAVCESQNATVRISPDIFQIVASQVSIDDLDGLPLITVRDVALRGWKLAVKRLMDVVVSAIGLILLSPIFLLIAVLIKLESKGPVFYTQVRVGLDGRPFPMIKFRSMRADAEQESGPVWATKDDPRRTRIGAFMRRTNIDEWPQLINVLLGDMSLVGPRPERPVFVEQFKQVVPRYMERHKEKGGITGWAQVNGFRGETSIVERTRYDLYYIENWSLWFDIKIILRTIINQFRGNKNAY